MRSNWTYFSKGNLTSFWKDKSICSIIFCSCLISGMGRKLWMSSVLVLPKYFLLFKWEMLFISELPTEHDFISWIAGWAKLHDCFSRSSRSNLAWEKESEFNFWKLFGFISNKVGWRTRKWMKWKYGGFWVLRVFYFFN